MAISPITEVHFNFFKAIFRVEDDFLVPLLVDYVFEQEIVFILVTKNNALSFWKHSNSGISKIDDTKHILTPYLIYQLEFLHGIPFRH